MTLTLRELWLLIGCIVTVAVIVAVLFDRWWSSRRNPVRTEGVTAGPLPMGIVLIDDDGMVTYTNPTARRLLTLPDSPTPLPDTPWRTLLLDDVAQVRKTTIGQYRTVYIERDEQWRHWWVATQGEQAVVVIEDVTTLHHAEQNAHRMISDLTHEIRTPVATILTHIEVLKLPHLSPDVRSQSLAFMQGEGQRLDRLVQNMTELMRLETSATLDLRPIDLAPLVEEVLAQCQPRAGEQRMSLTTNHADHLPLVLGDRGRLKQLFLNLIENALKYGRAGDKVVVTLRHHEGGIVCTVADTGPGIAEKHLPFITHRFYRASGERISGNGLGLALVVEILRRHQSTLNVSSRATGDNTGTTFTFTLPTLKTQERNP